MAVAKAREAGAKVIACSSTGNAASSLAGNAAAAGLKTYIFVPSRAPKGKVAQLMTFGAMIVDARHKPTADDCTMAQWYRDAGCPFVVVANKLDKLKKREIESNLLTIRETLELDDSVKLIPFSAEKGEGKQELLDLILSKL